MTDQHGIRLVKKKNLEQELGETPANAMRIGRFPMLVCNDHLSGPCADSFY